MHLAAVTDHDWLFEHRLGPALQGPLFRTLGCSVARLLQLTARDPGRMAFWLRSWLALCVDMYASMEAILGGARAPPLSLTPLSAVHAFPVTHTHSYILSHRMRSTPCTHSRQPPPQQPRTFDMLCQTLEAFLAQHIHSSCCLRAFHSQTVCISHKWHQPDSKHTASQAILLANATCWQTANHKTFVTLQEESRLTKRDNTQETRSSFDQSHTLTCVCCSETQVTLSPVSHFLTASAPV